MADLICTDIPLLKRALEATKRQAFGGGRGKARVEPAKGIALGQAIDRAIRIQAQLDAALRLREDVEGEESDEELVGGLEEDAHGMPDHHLVPFVREYCARFGLDMPRRIVVGGS